METNQKLNYKNTMYIGLAFFSILLLWQVYNYSVPIFLDNMNINDTSKGVIMALDNLIALLLIPIFGKLSDNTKSRFGKRKPFIFVGTILAAITFPFVGLFGVSNNLIGLIVFVGVVLLCMNIYRAPAVALMPDLTHPKNRSMANAIINFMGGLGALLAYGLLSLFFKGETKLLPYYITSFLMILSLLLLIFNVKENKAVTLEKEDTKEKIKKSKNLFLILFAVFGWFFGVNAVETFWSMYSINVLNSPTEGSGAIALLILSATSLVFYIPSGYLANKIGRKNSILLGILLMVIPFVSISFFRSWEIYFFIIFFMLAGIGWAMINVNSYPLVVEMASKNNKGTYTGIYYTFSMAAQTLSPVFVGFLMDFSSRLILFPYAVIFLLISFLLILNFKEKKDKTNKKIYLDIEI